MTKEVKNTKIGRPKGSPNARTQDLFEIAHRLDCNPFEVLILFAKGDYEALGYEEIEERKDKEGKVICNLKISPELRQKSAKDACEYLFPKRKPVDHEGKSDADPVTSFIEAISGLKQS